MEPINAMTDRAALRARIEEQLRSSQGFVPQGSQGDTFYIPYFRGRASAFADVLSLLDAEPESRAPEGICNRCGEGHHYSIGCNRDVGR